MIVQSSTPKDLVWAAWSPGAILVYRHGQVRAQVLPHSYEADWRYLLKLYHWDEETLLLRFGSRFGTSLFESKRYEPFQPVKDFPDALASLPPNEVIPGREGDVVGMSPSHLIVWTAKKSLVVHPLPKGFAITDLDWDRRNRLWICGAAPTDQLTSLKYRRAFAVSKDEGVSWSLGEIAHGGFTESWRSLLSGAEETYRKINIVNNYVVLSAETDDLENTTTFLFVKDTHGKWRSGTLKGDSLRAVVPAPKGGVEIISHYGHSVLITAGEKWRHRNLVPRVHEVMKGVNIPFLDQMRYEILDARIAFSGELILVVSLRLPRENQLVRSGEAVVIMSEEIDRLVTFHNDEDPEIITACSLQ